MALLLFTYPVYSSWRPKVLGTQDLWCILMKCLSADSWNYPYGWLVWWCPVIDYKVTSLMAPCFAGQLQAFPPGLKAAVLPIHFHCRALCCRIPATSAGQGCIVLNLWHAIESANVNPLHHLFYLLMTTIS